MDNNINEKRLKVIEVSKVENEIRDAKERLAADALLFGIGALGTYLGFSHATNNIACFSSLIALFGGSEFLMDIGNLTAYKSILKNSKIITIEKQNNEKGRSL